MMRRKLHAVGPPPPSADSDALARVTIGDLSGLGELYDRHAQDLWRFVRRAAPQEDADDVVHVVFVRLLNIASSYDGRAPSARAWLFGVAALVLKERRRSFQRLASALLGHALVAREPASPTASPAASVDVDRALARLTEAKRVVLVLAEVEGFSCPEIAKILTIPIGTVWTRLHHARAELRSHFEEGPP